MKVFLAVCADINFPVAIEKTFWGSNRLTFLGMLLDTWEQVIGLPVDKIEKAILLVRSFVSRKKATVLEFQKLCGYLNFYAELWCLAGCLLEDFTARSVVN